MRNLLHRAQNLYRFHNPREKKGVKRIGDKAQDEYMRWTITETDDGRSFLFTKFSVIDFFLTEKSNIFMYTAEIGLWQIFQFSIFVPGTRNTITQVKDLTFGISFRILFYFPFLGNIEWHRLLEIRIFLFFLAAIIRENLDMRPWIEKGHRFAIHLLTWHSWLVISNTCKKLS